MSESGDLLSMADLMRIVRRRSKILVMITLAVFVMASAMVLSMKSLAEARAGLALQRSTPAVFDSTGDQTNAWELWANTQREQILSRRVLEQVLQSGIMQSNPTYAKSQDPITTLAKRITANTNRQSWYVTVTLSDEDPSRAELALQALIDAFLDEQDRLRADRSRKTLDTLVAKHTEAEFSHRQCQEAERTLREEHRLVIADPDRNPPALRLVSLIERQAALEDKRIQKQTMVDLITKAESTELPDERREALLHLEPIATSPAVTEILAAWRVLRVEEASLAEKYGDRHPRLIELRQQLSNRALQVDQAISHATETIKNENEGLNNQYRSLESEIERARTDLLEYRKNLDRLRVLSQQTQGAEQILNDIAQRLAQEKAQSALIFTEVLQPVDPPRASWDRRDSKRPVFLLAAALGALASGLVGAVFWDLIEGRNLTAQAIRRVLQQPVFAEVPSSPGIKPFETNNEPEAVMEAFRMVRQGILPSLSGSRGTVIALMSVNSREGKSLCAARLAMTFSAAGATTLLVDGDLRKRSLTQSSGTTNNEGLSELLSGSDGVSTGQIVGEETFDLMPAGAPVNSPGDLLHSHCLEEWIEQARRTYAIIIIDTPSLASYSDAQVLAGSADVGLVVIDAGVTSNAALESALNRLGLVRKRIIGAILNSRGRAREAEPTRER